MKVFSTHANACHQWNSSVAIFPLASNFPCRRWDYDKDVPIKVLVGVPTPELTNPKPVQKGDTKGLSVQ